MQDSQEKKKVSKNERSTMLRSTQVFYSNVKHQIHIKTIYLTF